MGFKELKIDTCYESGVNDIVEEFYEPVLSEATTYDRIAGFFCSSTLAVASRGLARFIQNGGKMRLITCPRLSQEDIAAIKDINDYAKTITPESLGFSFDEMTDLFTKNHVKALGWMLSHGLLEIRFAIVVGNDGKACDETSILQSGLFHQKVGILTDKNGDSLSFSGSINETASAWINNDEEFKVFYAWDSTFNYYLKDRARFDEIWSGTRENIRVFDIPNAIKEDLISHSSDFNIEDIAITTYRKLKAEKKAKDGTLINLFPYQSEALKTWRSNAHQLLFEMATGTGKTRTAIAGMSSIFDKLDKVIAIISCPQNTLAKQWKKEVEALKVPHDYAVIIDGTNHTWRTDLQLLFMKCKTGLINKAIIYTVHNTASSEDFTKYVEKNVSPALPIVFIGDEAHWLGARKLRAALRPEYMYRIGLSATPSRWFDDYGTTVLRDYFGNNSFEFTIKDALREINPLTGKHFLVNYLYNIERVSLTEDEAFQYRQITNKLSKLYRVKEHDQNAAERYDRLLEQRADIVKNADEKYEVFSRLIDELKSKNELEDLLIFVSPQQINRVQEILGEKNIVSHKLTKDEGTIAEARYGNISEREFIIKKFVSKDYKAIVAIKCLDEGIDIPTASRGILMASSTNPREYIQRIGRIIRQAPGKGIASLYDICVNRVDCLDEEDNEVESRIRNKEKNRLKEIAENAINYAELLSTINEL